MPFEELETLTRQNMPPQATISYDYAHKKGNGVRKPDAKPRLTISIPTTLCGTSKSKRWIVQVGTGDHVGKLRIAGELLGLSIKRAAAERGVEPSQHAHFFRWNFGFVPRLGDEETFDGEKRPVTKIGDEEFEIDVPKSWFEGGSAA